MAYANWYFYNRTWHGSMTAQEFERWSARASLEIDRATQGRAAAASESMRDALAQCCCALADHLEAWAAQDAKTQAGAVASENVDGYSVSWRDGGTSAEMRADRQAVLSGICSDYLTYPENLMYTGVWRP